jgi:hypothetical protein
MLIMISTERRDWKDFYIQLILSSVALSVMSSTYLTPKPFFTAPSLTNNIDWKFHLIISWSQLVWYFGLKACTSLHLATYQIFSRVFHHTLPRVLKEKGKNPEETFPILPCGRVVMENLVDVRATVNFGWWSTSTLDIYICDLVWPTLFIIDSRIL